MKGFRSRIKPLSLRPLIARRHTDHIGAGRQFLIGIVGPLGIQWSQSQNLVDRDRFDLDVRIVFLEGLDQIVVRGHLVFVDGEQHRRLIRIGRGLRARRRRRSRAGRWGIRHRTRSTRSIPRLTATAICYAWFTSSLDTDCTSADDLPSTPPLRGHGVSEAISIHDTEIASSHAVPRAVGGVAMRLYDYYLFSRFHHALVFAGGSSSMQSAINGAAIDWRPPPA